MGIDKRLSSIQGLYMGIAKGEVGGFTVPAFNLRGMTEELSHAIFAAAKATNTGAFILEIARSEMGYTGQNATEFVRRILIGADKAGWNGPIFVQADHSQAKIESPGKIAEGEIGNIKKLMDADMAAGFFNIDIDASTLVDTSLSTVEQQQKINASVTATLARYIRERQPEGVEISIGGEIGHIGERNSTREDLVVFDRLFREEFGVKHPGLSKVSVQTGTSHGGKMLPNGKMEAMKIDFGVIESLSKLAKSLGMGGVVQHGASTLAEDMFGKFPQAGAIEIHLSTGWQNMIMDHPSFPTNLKNEIYKWLDDEKGSERKGGESDKQFYYRTRKYAWGQFRSKFDALDQDFKINIKDEMEKRCALLFKELKVENTLAVVKKYINFEQNLSLSRSKLRTVELSDVRGKRVIVRVDWNVTQGKALQIIDDTRIVRTIPTIKWLLDHGAKQIILMSHLGKSEERRSLDSVVKYAQKLVGENITLVSEYSGAPLRLSDRLIMLENLRLWDGEEENDPEFARSLASCGDIYVNEAFGESHRDVASIVSITKYLPSYAGIWFMDEVETIQRVLVEPARPFVVVMGGAKVEDKIKLISKLSQIADTILLGGKLANEYILRGLKIEGKAKIMIPRGGSKLFDIDFETQEIYKKVIADARTIVWNGPMGKVEDEPYRKGTRAIYEAICANQSAYTLVGGGDTLAAIGKEEHLSRIDHVSTGGGAMLKLLEEGSLVGIQVLQS